jgi:hypothetical protein
MTGYEAFSLYTSLKLHFNSDSYDYFRYNGKVNTSVDAFENRKDKWHFYKLSRRFANEEQGRDFIVANLVHDPNVWVGNLLVEESNIQYRKRQKVIQSLTYTFTNEIVSLFEHKDANASFIIHDGEYPELLQKLLHDEISIETVCVLNKLLNFIPVMGQENQ